MGDGDMRQSGTAPMARWLTALPVALMFLTRLPLRAPKAELAGAVAAFPVVGLIVGALGGAGYWLATTTGLSPAIAAFLALAVTVIATGALHEDGLADSADGLAGATREDSIRIMRDSRSGGYGVLAMVFSVGLRAAALATLGGPLPVLLAMMAAGALSRAAMPPAMLALPRASASGQGAAAGRPVWLDVAVGLILAGLAALLLVGIVPGMAATGAVAVAALGVAALARRRLGGYTGDVLGAIQQVAEIAALLALAALH